MSFNSISESQKQTEVMYMLRGKLSNQYKNYDEAKEIIDYLVECVNKAAGTNIACSYQNSKINEDIDSFNKYKAKTSEQIEYIKQKIREGLSNSGIHRETGFDRRTIARVRNEMYKSSEQYD